MSDSRPVVSISYAQSRTNRSAPIVRYGFARSSRYFFVGWLDGGTMPFMRMYVTMLP